MEKLLKDPRPDLIEDSKDWTRFLNLVKNKNEILANTLHGFRCCGLRLYEEKIGYVLKPEFNFSSEWEDQTEYEEDREKYLIPHKTELIELLNRLKKN